MNELTPHELRIYALVAQGLPNKLIAHRLGRSVSVVKHHVGVIMEKLGLTNRVQVALKFHGIDFKESA